MGNRGGGPTANTARGRRIRRVLILGGLLLFVVSVIPLAVIALGAADMQAAPPPTQSSPTVMPSGAPPLPSPARPPPTTVPSLAPPPDPVPPLGDAAPPASAGPGGGGSMGAPDTDPASPSQVTATEAINFLRAYAIAHPEIDLAWVEQLIDDQRDLIAVIDQELQQSEREVAELEERLANASDSSISAKTHTQTQADSASGVTIAVSIAGAITGAVAAVAGVLSAIAAMEQQQIPAPTPPTPA
jgi:hypothetical protein